MRRFYYALSEVVAYANHLTEGEMDWKVYFGRENKNIWRGDFLHRLIWGNIWKYNIKIRLWETNVLQSVITTANMT
jgi:hypothetical protein